MLYVKEQKTSTKAATKHDISKHKLRPVYQNKIWMQCVRPDAD